MSIGGVSIPLGRAKKDAESVCRRVVAAVGTMLPPNSEAVIPVKLAEQEKFGSRDGDCYTPAIPTPKMVCS